MTSPPQPDPSGSSPTPAADQPGRKPSPKAALLAAALILGLGIGLGFACYSLGLGHPQGAVFRLLVGLPLGFVGLGVLYLLKFGSRHVLILAGLGAVASLLSIHYFEYRNFPKAWVPELQNVALAQQVEELHQSLREHEMARDQAVAAERQRPSARQRELIEKLDAGLAEMRAKLPARLELDPERARKAEPLLQRFHDDTRAAAGDRGPDEVQLLGPWVHGMGFWEYLDLRAQQGETYKPPFGKAIHLGYRTTYLLWFGEVLLAALIMVLLMRKLARDQELKQTFHDMEQDFRKLPG